MIGLTLDRSLQSVLCLGAHPDDIEIGASGLINRLSADHPEARFSFVILTGEGERLAEGEKSMRALLGDRASLLAASYRDGFLPYDDPAGVKLFIRDSVDVGDQQLVISPWESDRHQDHAFVGALVAQIFRDHLVLSYEIPKYDADLGRPQLFVPLTSREAEAKVDHLSSHFVSQQDKDWYDADAFRSVMRLRGVESKSAGGYAEAFHVSKIWLS